MVAGIDWLSCWENIRGCAAAAADSAGVGVAASDVLVSTGDIRESAGVGTATGELRMAASRCCKVFMPVPVDGLLASCVLWRCLLDGADDDLGAMSIGGLPSFG